MINPKDRELVSVLTAIVYGARMHAYDAARFRLSIQQGRALEPPDIIDTTRIAVTVVHAVTRHIPPKARSKP